MPRIKIKKQSQVDFLNNLRTELGLDWVQVPKVFKIHPRSLSDWKRGKYTLPEKFFKQCIKVTKGKIAIPSYKVLPDFWSVKKAARKGGLMVAKKYGNLGTPEGRKKGGLISQQKRKLHPELYQHCNLRKDILKPRNSSELAEFFGIVLGDGGISNHQVAISLKKENGKKYIFFVCKLIKKLFGVTPAIYYFQSMRSRNVVGITTSTISLVDFLLSKGLKRGNKVKQQVGVPMWIKKRIDFSKSCLRGLVDTDGGVYFHRHKSHGRACFNIGLQFTNKSFPILTFANETLLLLGFTPKLNERSLNLYREAEVYRYAREIRFNNSYHQERLNKFSKMKYGEVRRIG